MDGMILARSVRELAKQARAVLGQTDPSEEDSLSLLETIARLEVRLEPGTSNDLGRWLASLRHLVEERIATLV